MPHTKTCTTTFIHGNPKMSIKFQLTTIAALLTVSGVSQAALTSTSGTVSFSGSAQVTATANNVTSATNSNNGANVANLSLNQFDASAGVLIGADLQLTSSRLQVIDGYGYKNNGSPKIASGSGISSAALNASGVGATFSSISQTGGSCSLTGGPTGNINCSWGPNTATAEVTNATATVNAANLDDYVGNGTVTAALSLPTLSATSTITNLAGPNNKGSITNYTVEWSGDLQANYSYLRHALASFDGSSSSNTLTLDFGTVAQNANAALSFGLFNLADANRIGLDLDSVSGSGDTGAFSTDLLAFADLAQGSSQSFIANLLTANTGAFSAQYLLNLSDADLGAASTRHNYQLTLNLVGNVTAVPVPAAVWSFLSGFLGLLAFAKRNAKFA